MPGNLKPEYQQAFIGGRRVFCSVLICDERLDSRLKVRVPGLMCKLDLDKTYDHVNYESCIVI